MPRNNNGTVQEAQPTLRFSAPPPPPRQKAQGILDNANDLQYAIQQLQDMLAADRPTVGREIVWAGLVTLASNNGLQLAYNEKDKRYELYAAEEEAI